MVTVTVDRSTTTPQDVAVSISEAARIIGTSPQNLMNWHKKGWLPFLEEAPGRGIAATVDLGVAQSVAALRSGKRHKSTKGRRYTTRISAPNPTPPSRSQPDPTLALPTRPATITITITVTADGVTVSDG